MAWATVVVWLGLALFAGSVEVTLLDRMTRKDKTKLHIQRIVVKPSHSHRRHNNLQPYSKQHLSHFPRGGNDFKESKLKKRDDFELNSKKNITSTSKIIAKSSAPTISYTTFVKLGGSYPRKETKNKVHQQRIKIPNHFNPPSLSERWDLKFSNGTARDEDGLIKRSRNRVRLKTQRSRPRKMNSPKQNFITFDSKAPIDTDILKEKKRQRISGGITNTNRINALGNGNAMGMSDEGMRLAGNPDSFFADPMVARPQQRVLHSTHYFAPAVHRFLPAQHRYPSAPIHRYLTSPVIFKDGNSESYPALGGFESRAVLGPVGPFVQAPLPPFISGQAHPGDRVIVVNRPIHTPVPVPVNRPPKVVLVHHPAPLPPQPVSMPLIPRPPPFLIVHHREFSSPLIDPCGVNPCRNGGTCTAVVTEFKCICPLGYKGDRCEVQSRCTPNPCKNFGKCTELPDDFECTCHTGFHGKACDMESKCEPNPCRNGGVCTENFESYVCSCAAGFMGKNCEQESKCLPVNPCKNGGVCTEDLSGYNCNCKDGYNGINCEVRETSTACDSYPCRNGATCIADVYDPTRYSCYCASGFTGLSCEDLACGNCPSPGICIKGVCRTDYDQSSEKSFQSLALATSPCMPNNPCLFGGHCLPDGEDYSCLCPEGRGGSHCEYFFQESSCNGCHHHAVCISSKCVCRQGYSGDGKICRPKTSQCHPNPCENGGTCRDEDAVDSHQADWWCECPKGYSGRRCHEYDPCSNFKCHNGGRCESTNNEPRCICAAPWEGPNCLLDNYCLPKDGENRNPCKNGGQCEFTNGDVKCVCPVQYEGPTCAEDKCAKCDKHAFCEKGICKCRPPYTGDGITCNEPEELAKSPPTNPSELPNSCSPNKCLNGAACIEGKNTFYCVCPEHTSGRLCEKKTTPTTAPPKAACHPNPCLNGGICKDTGVNQDFDCICPNPRFKGRFCDVDMCAECDPHARCINGKCFCRRGYKGDGVSCKKVKPKAKCPPYSTTISGDICICNPGYFMSNTGKRACIPNGDISRNTLQHLQHRPKLEIPPPAENPVTRNGQEWSEDIIVTEYRSLGCWADTTEWRNPSKRAMMVMEGLDPLLADNYHERKQPISKCAEVAKRLGLRVFAIQNGGQCFGGADANTYKTYGSSEKCADGVGGSLANDVYKL